MNNTKSNIRSRLTLSACFCAIALLSSCKSDHHESTFTDTSETRAESPARLDHGEIPEGKEHLAGWLGKWRNHLSDTSEKKEEGVALLKKAQQTFTASDFAYILEKISDDADEDTLASLRQELATLVLENNSQKIPKWFRLLKPEELKQGVAYTMGELLGKSSATAKRDKLLATFENKKAKVKFMFGYQMAKVKAEPNKTFNQYLEWGVKIGGLEPLPKLIEVMPDTSDWEACDKKIPRSKRHIAVKSRAAVYKRWAEVDVVQLITHLLATNRYGDHLHKALKIWGDKDPEALDDWMAQVESIGYQNPAWDAVKRIRTENLMVKHPAEAKKHVFKIKDDQKRMRLWLKVYAIWIKTDYKAAYAARQEYGRRYPPKPHAHAKP